ncbi:GNAT family N-acetyltransferase [Tolypothrix sp. FACHB-123]|uniref:GNAT family N-acetyltransferase n=1 Tax=Tolypothrix sp. FACHB-123 TaxID=2692868 RepID=UPI0016864788|nr:GNAT family N-acetyltransferase [Tolypothrix sp. FACHB-123]MBD2355483.1 GNAT family N-acetyltransferase [Tolypothrix sp. FACHB-123]
MAQLKNLVFRQATTQDSKVICEIHNSNARGETAANQHGFLLEKTTEEEVVQNLNENIQYFVAVNSSNEILGFVTVAKPKISNIFLNQVIWQDDTYKPKILSEHHLYIQKVATKVDYMGKGIAQFMYKSLYEKFPNSVITAFIVSKPIFNERSFRFHQQQGFQQIGTIQKELFLDLRNYESVLMVKET